MAINIHRTLSLDFLSHEMTQCTLGVSLFSSDTAGKHVL